MSNYLKSVRVRCGMTQTDVAKILEISAPAYCKKERGKTEFTLNELRTLKSLFHLGDYEFCKIFFQ